MPQCQRRGGGGGAGAAPRRGGGGGGLAGTRVTADATVLGASDASIAPKAESGVVFDPHAAYSTGPDGATPAPCDVDAAATTECTVAPTDCVDGAAVAYSGGWCVAGTCRWQVQGSTQCVGPEQPGARCAPPGSPRAPGGSFTDDAGTWAVFSGCAYPVPAGPQPPQVSCSGGDGGSGVCVPPPSVCASTVWLVYYDQGECDAGQCTWQERYARCADGCASGACRGPFTTPPM
jgi:hypothetical protein